MISNTLWARPWLHGLLFVHDRTNSMFHVIFIERSEMLLPSRTSPPRYVSLSRLLEASRGLLPAQLLPHARHLLGTPHPSCTLAAPGHRCRAPPPTSVPCHFLEPQLLPLARLLTPDHALALLRLLPCSSGSAPCIPIPAPPTPGHGGLPSTRSSRRGPRSSGTGTRPDSLVHQSPPWAWQP